MTIKKYIRKFYLNEAEILSKEKFGFVGKRQTRWEILHP
jgi:hypothetical protein